MLLPVAVRSPTTRTSSTFGSMVVRSGPVVGPRTTTVAAVVNTGWLTLMRYEPGGSAGSS